MRGVAINTKGRRTEDRGEEPGNRRMVRTPLDARIGAVGKHYARKSPGMGMPDRIPLGIMPRIL